MNKFAPKGKVKQINGSVLTPEMAGLRIILNVCGEDGKYEAELDKLLTKRFLKVREDYKMWFSTRQDWKKGSINNTAVASDTWVCNMLVKDKTGKVADKDLLLGVKNLCKMAKYEHGSVHVSHLLTTEMPTLQNLLMEHLVAEGVSVYFYQDADNQ